MSKSSNIAKRSSDTESTTAYWMPHRYSGMSGGLWPKITPGDIEVWLMSLPQDSHASLSVSPLPENNLAKMTPETCGRQRSMSFAQLDRPTAFWRTSLGCAQRNTDTLGRYSATWPRQGMMLDGECYQHTALEHHIGEIDSGSLLIFPTPTVSDCKGGHKVNVIMKGERFERISQTSGQKFGAKLSAAVWFLFGKRLTPNFSEMMMGWPIGWTALKPLEMDRFQQWRRLHGCCSPKI